MRCAGMYECGCNQLIEFPVSVGRQPELKPEAGLSGGGEAEQHPFELLAQLGGIRSLQPDRVVTLHLRIVKEPASYLLRLLSLHESGLDELFTNFGIGRKFLVSIQKANYLFACTLQRLQLLLD